MTPDKIIDQFDNQTIAVIGDVMLDRYIYGAVERISSEAPIPVVQKRDTQIVPGGAGNTAANVTALGAKCALFGVVGHDTTGQELTATLGTFDIDATGLLQDNRPTTEKTRVLGNHQQIVRIDHEVTRPLDAAQIHGLCETLRQTLPRCQAIIVCDYAKGVVSQALMDCIRAIAHTHKIPVLADVRPEHRDFYHDLTYITPNKKETAGMVNQPIRTLDDAKTQGLNLAKSLRTNILLTMSEDGLLLIDHKAGRIAHLPTKAQEVIDVSGAGDTVIATLALALAAGANPTTAATLANHAASVVVAKLGTATLSQDELRKSFNV